MSIKLFILTLLTSTSLCAMIEEQGTLLKMLPQDLKKEVITYLMHAPGRLDTLPIEIQEELIKYLVTPAPSKRLFVMLPWNEFKDIITQVRPLFLQDMGLKRIWAITRQAGGGSVMDVIRLLAALNVPSATKWLKEYLKKQGELGLAVAGEMALDIVRGLGDLRKQSFDQPLSKEQRDLETFLQTTLNTLLSLGIDVNQKDLMSERTALQEALFLGDLPTIRLLLQHGADTNGKTKDGRTLIDIAKDAQKEAATAKNLALEKTYEEIIKLVGSQPATKE